MRFRKLSEQYPEFGKEVLIRYRDWNNNYRYYVCVLGYKSNKDRTLVFEESCGEQYAQWNIEEVESWIYTSELDNIEWGEDRYGTAWKFRYHPRE